MHMSRDTSAPYLSVIIPAYNEELTISRTVLAVDAYLARQGYSYEILVVSDGSHDKTAQIIEKLTGFVSHLRLIANEHNRGKGAVVRQGMLEARGAIRLFMDADNATTIDHFAKMKPLFDEGYDIVIGTRDRKDAPGAEQVVKQAAWKRMLGNAGNLYIQLLAVPGIWDTQCGFKAATAEAAEKIFRVAVVDRWAFDVEMLALARRFGLRVGKVGVLWRNNPNSRVKISSYLQVLWETLKIRVRLWAGIYQAAART